MFGTALLVGCVFAIIDKNNNTPDKGATPMIIGLTVFVIGATFGYNCGYAINPARDLGPRLFTAMAGWGAEVFTWVFYPTSLRGRTPWIHTLNKPLACSSNASLQIAPNSRIPKVRKELSTEQNILDNDNVFFISFSAGDHWFWVPIVGCFLGAVLGALAYIGLIEMHHPEDDPSKPGVELENITIKSNHE